LSGKLVVVQAKQFAVLADKGFGEYSTRQFLEVLIFDGFKKARLDF